MDRFTSYSGNGYVERRSQELRSLNRQVSYQKEQKELEKEIQNHDDPKPSTPTPQQNIQQMQQLNSLPQNHLKFPGNNQFH